jgi:hypothetical protein
MHGTVSVPEDRYAGKSGHDYGHDYYAELCALAAGGLLEGTEMSDFRAHLKGCSECRSEYQEMSSLVTRDLPQAQGTLQEKLSAMRARPSQYSRQRFLRRARAEGIVFSREVEHTGRSDSWFPSVPVLAALASLVLIAIGLMAYHFRETPNTNRAAGAAAAQQIAELKRQSSELSASLSRSSESIAAQQREIQSLRTQLGSATATAENLRRSGGQAAGVAERSSTRNVNLLEESRDQEKLLAEAKAEAARANDLRASDDASLVEQLARVTELTNKLRIANATLDQERQLAATGKSVGELMASRQLHVIDVRDTDPNGNLSPAFGRVFLTEGKSLTFYAFDLNEDGLVNAKRSFQVWAVPEAGKSSARSLGFLHVDAKAQGRWVLKVENLELVKQISSVFVTVEPAAGGKQPSGQKMLYAYLGEANHP